MSVTVFTWDMFKFGKYFGVGHAAMHVHGPHGNVYISFWPAQHSLSRAIWSTGKVHFMSGDKEEDGTPGWASKPLDNLDEARIVKFWNGFDTSELDYKGAASANQTKTNPGGRTYNILFSQCSTTVVAALLAGADLTTRNKIVSWLALNAGSNVDFGGNRNVFRYLPFFQLPTITPADVRELVKAVWDDF